MVSYCQFVGGFLCDTLDTRRRTPIGNSYSGLTESLLGTHCKKEKKRSVHPLALASSLVANPNA